MLFGAAAIFFAADYTIGSAAKMGPGYFPFALGVLLAALGVALLLRSVIWTKGSQAAAVLQLKPLVLVLSSVILFGLILRPLGLLVATTLLVVVSSLASHEFRWTEALLNAAVLIVVVIVVFVYLLEFQVPVWPAFMAVRA
jgi:hypothetical protein